MRDIIVIPTYNESQTIAALLREISRVVPTARLLVVDDNSPDGTADIVRQLRKDLPQLELTVRSNKTGLASAYLETFQKLIADTSIRTVTTMDADFSHSPRYIPTLLKESFEYDIVIGSRYTAGGGTKGWNARRRLLSQGGNLYARLVSGVPIHDLTAGFVTFRREALARIPFDRIHSSKGYGYTIESKCLAYILGARIKEVPIIFEERRAGASKLSGHTFWEGLLSPWRIRFPKFLA